MVSAGGGAVGAALLGAALGARSLTGLREAPWRLVTGSRLSAADAEVLGRGLPSGVTLERFREDLPELIAAAAVSISQAGYNTVVEGLRAATPMVLVPFAAAGEDEQTTRAARLAERGLAAVVAESDLDAASLAAAIEAAASLDMAGAGRIGLDGAERSAELLLQLPPGGAHG